MPHSIELKSRPAGICQSHQVQQCCWCSPNLRRTSDIGGNQGFMKCRTTSSVLPGIAGVTRQALIDTAVPQVVLLGLQSVGKSCLLDRYINSTFEETPKNTIGAAFAAKKVGARDSIPACRRSSGRRGPGLFGCWQRQLVCMRQLLCTCMAWYQTQAAHAYANAGCLIR